MLLASGPYMRKVTKPDGGRQRTNFVLGDDGKNEKGKEDPFALFLTLSCHIRECARSFPTTSDTHEEYCNHVPEEKAKERRGR